MINRLKAGTAGKLGQLLGPSVLLAISLFFIISSLSLRIGVPQSMGPGFLPLVLAILLFAVSSFLILHVIISNSADVPEIVFKTGGLAGLRGIFCVICGITAFIVLLPILALIPTVFVATAILASSQSGLNTKRILLLSTFTAVSVWLIFIQLLGLSITPFDLDLPWMR